MAKNHESLATQIIVRVCIIINILLLCIPLGVTLKSMGMFSMEPAITTKIQASDYAPVLKIVADDGFKPRSYLDARENLQELMWKWQSKQQTDWE